MERGFALIYQLLATAVVVMLVGSLLTVSRYQVFSAQNSLDSLQAQYAAESGVATVMAQLSQNPGWSGAYTAEPVGSGGATFNFRFAAGQSVNNIPGSTAVDSFLGTASVPAGSALVVVEGNYRGVRRTVECFVVGGGDWIPDDAVAASGKILMKGNVVVDGYDSLRGLGVVSAGLHSNQAGGAQAISWQGTSSEVLRVNGKLSTPSQDANAIDLGSSGTATTQGNALGSPYRRLGRLNIPAMVSSHAGPPETLPATGQATLSPGDHYFNGDQTLNGDLVLQDGAQVYINGNVKINGSIKGKGALVVNGNTRFYGDAEVVGDKNQYVSVLSRGHVVVSGYDGSAHLDALAAADPPNASTPRGQETGELWTDIKDSFNWLQTYLTANTDPDTWVDADMDSRSAVLAGGQPNWGDATSPTNLANLPNQPMRNSNLALRARLNDAVPAERFLKQRFQRIDDLLRAANWDRSGLKPDPPVVATDWLSQVRAYQDGSWDPASSGGLFDLAQSLYIGRALPWNAPYLTAADLTMMSDQFLPEMMRQVDQFNYSRIGAAQFRGLVYAQGGILALDEVSVLGTVVCNGDASIPDLNEGSYTVKAGQVQLEKGSRFTYVRDMFQQGVSNLTAVGVLGVRGWRLR